jgi:hypothetical protein
MLVQPRSASPNRRCHGTVLQQHGAAGCCTAALVQRTTILRALWCLSDTPRHSDIGQQSECRNMTETAAFCGSDFTVFWEPEASSSCRVVFAAVVSCLCVCGRFLSGCGHLVVIPDCWCVCRRFSLGVDLLCCCFKFVVAFFNFYLLAFLILPKTWF